MAARKLQQEVEKCFKKVDEGVAEFEMIYDKIEQATSSSQKEKQEDNLKKEIKKLQRLRDQIKTWAASNEIKDKGPLMDKRKLIETHMERFKAVEKAMKTKAYSKEGLSAATKLDPLEQAKAEAGEFLGDMVSELERQIETLEAEEETIRATMKKGKGQSAKQDRIARIDKATERHKWHIGRLELMRRSLENGGIETQQVLDLEETIRYYVSDNMNDDFMEDEEMYDELHLQEEEDVYGMNNENDRVSSQDTQSIQDDEPEARSNSIPGGKSKVAAAELPVAAARRPSTQLKSPAPALATLHTPLTDISNNSQPVMKPAAIPARAPGETLRYASAAAAAAACEKSSMGIAPLPPPTEGLPAPKTAASHPPLPATAARRPSIAPQSPKAVSSQDISTTQVSLPKPNIPAVTEASSDSRPKSPSIILPCGSTPPSVMDRSENSWPSTSRASSGKTAMTAEAVEFSKNAPAPKANGASNGVKQNTNDEPEESIYHLPPGMQDLLKSFEATQQRVSSPSSQANQRMLEASLKAFPDLQDISVPRNRKVSSRYGVATSYPQEPASIFDDSRLYSRIDPDTLFYVFYYKQGTYQQYLAAKALKDQSWRFHKQYQTWFQRHEEPKAITEEFEQGTYRFFDYESTWMNRRKADFRFAYKFLEDVV
ncbi:Not1 N-terminal domain, CCR4-Not complex component-domain-containing protein [Calycina marina]|uniref:General negative regulator of transcription subunit n=1 Tax=Calycina marina TaxID=1763456 RepID=A0A9P8CFX8_9HELO|nr:Not1 N-terminal domain, CCR4-Not complex component-domain-containing protein [Calycina marina]